jgi:hypothetical protein
LKIIKLLNTLKGQFADGIWAIPGVNANSGLEWNKVVYVCPLTVKCSIHGVAGDLKLHLCPVLGSSIPSVGYSPSQILNLTCEVRVMDWRIP